MNPAYLLAVKLGISVVIQPEWDECRKLKKKGHEIWEEGVKLREEGGEEVDKIWSRWVECCEKRWGLYQEAVTRELGAKYVKHIDWDTGEVK